MLTSLQPPVSPLPKIPMDNLGCLANKLHTDQEFVGAGIKLYRKRSDDQHLGHVATPATDRGFLVGLSLRGGHQRRIFHGHHASSHDFEENAVYVRNFCDAYRADLRGSFDFLLLEVPLAAMDRVVDEAGGPRVEGITSGAGLKDPVLSHLLRALVPTLQRPAEANTLFVDQLAITIATYLSTQYGGRPAAKPAKSVKNRLLSHVHEARAKEMLSSAADGDLSIARVADACGLSRSYFIRAFRETTGQTPHHWLLAHRIARARELLARSELPLAEVAAICGFADQSHFTRVFAQAIGMPPGKWRRQSHL